MISSRWPRPIGIIESIAFRPVSIGSLTGWRCTTPGALCSAGRISVVSISPLPSSGLPSGSTIRPSSASPTGISSRRPVRLTVSPSEMCSHSTNSTAPTLSDSRLSARPVTSRGRSSISKDMQFSRPWIRQMPSATDSTVPTSVSSALEVSRPSIRFLRIEVISSGLICISAPFQARGLRLRDLLSKLFQPVLDRCVEDDVSDPEHHSAQDVRIDGGGHLDLAIDLFADPLAEAVDGGGRQLHGAGDLNREQLALLVP